jgi:very-short-patch-repair endonuclease
LSPGSRVNCREGRPPSLFLCRTHRSIPSTCALRITEQVIRITQLQQEEKLVPSQPLSNGDPLEGEFGFCGQMVTKWWPTASAVELEKDKTRFKSASALEQLYLCAKWRKVANLVIDVPTAIEKYDSSDRAKRDLIGQMYSDIVGPDFAPNIDLRLDWIKRRVARELEKKFKSDVKTHKIQSPIEQIFLMEWIFHRIDDVHGVRLEPHKELKTSDGTFTIDFVVSAPDLKLAIELDGHDFHEKTKAQVSHDKARERSIVRTGYVLLRFSGSEVFGNPGRYVNEVVDVIKQRRAGSTSRQSD